MEAESTYSHLRTLIVAKDFPDSGTIYFDTESNDPYVARRSSPTSWTIFGDDYGIGRKRPREGSVRRRASSSWWDIYKGHRLYGHARGPDGGAAGLVLIGCNGR